MLIRIQPRKTLSSLGNYLSPFTLPHPGKMHEMHMDVDYISLKLRYYKGPNQYVNKNVNFAAQQMLHLDVFVDIWSISPLTL